MIRRRTDFSEVKEDDLAEGVKRCRIQTTPGQIALHNDVKNIPADPDIRIDFTSDPLQILIHILVNGKTVSFLFTAPRIYPHKNPSISCLTESLESRYVNEERIVRHPLIDSNWSAIQTLSTVVSTLRTICVDDDDSMVVEDDMNCIVK